MSALQRLLARLRNSATNRRGDERLREEIQTHIAMETEENLRAGMSPAEARRRAALKFGSVEAIREDHHAEQSLPFFENLLFDLRYSVRMLLRSPGFSFIAIATIALGIGATTAAYTEFTATLLPPFPFPNPPALGPVKTTLPDLDTQDA